MSLIRCNQLLSKKHGSLFNVFKQSTVYYSDGKNSSDDGDQNNVTKADAEQTKSDEKKISPGSNKRLNSLLSRLSSRASAIDISKNVLTSKPIGYDKLRKYQKFDGKEREPRTMNAAARAVSQELGEEKIRKEILAPYKSDHPKNEYLEHVISSMRATLDGKHQGADGGKRQGAVTGAFTADDKLRVNSFAFRSRPLSSEDRGKLHAAAIKEDENPFESEPIGIFTSVDKLAVAEDSLKIWDKLEKYDLRLKMSLAPRNYYEKMAYWTEQGKIWHFPIDNEQGLDTEKATSFTEHIFLEEHLDPWCPKKGAVRNFMELVCIGLSKNPFLNVEQKHEHIEWYRNYFDKKRDMLERVIKAQNESQSQTAQVSDGIQNS